MPDTLKPCPFCGGTKLTFVDYEGDWYIGCYTCKTCGPNATTRDEAEKLWNKPCRVGEGEKDG